MPGLDLKYKICRRVKFLEVKMSKHFRGYDGHIDSASNIRSKYIHCQKLHRNATYLSLYDECK